MKRRALRLVAALTLGVLGACTAHAPRRMAFREGSPQVITATVDQLSDAWLRRQAPAVEIHPEFTLAFIEFDDQGNLWSRAQLDQLDRTLVSEAERESTDGVVLVFFAHGWQHDAGVCDENVACFRTFLARIASDLAAATGASPGREKPPRVVGVYAGWRGRSVTVPVLRNLSFWARKRVAERIGAGELIEVLTHVDQFVQRQNADGRVRSGLNVIAHSFGGTMVYEAIANILKMRVVEALGRRTSVRPDDNLVDGFGDLVVLVNPAFEASRYAPIESLLAQFQSFSRYQSPVLIVAESDNDVPNRTWFRIGRTLDVLFQRTGPRSGRGLLTTAVGNYEPFVTHRLEAIEPTPVRGLRKTTGFGSVSGCRCRLPLADLPEDEVRGLRLFISRERTGKLAEAEGVPEESACASGIVLGRARLTCRPGIDPSRPFWVVRANDDVVQGHSGFFTSPFLDFVRHVILDARTKKAERHSSR